MLHEIKLNEQFCDDVYNRRKTFEIRYNDHFYREGDYIKFIPTDGEKEIDHPIKKKIYEITYVLSGWNIPDGYVVFSIKDRLKRVNTKI